LTIDTEVFNEQAQASGEMQLSCRLYDPAGQQVAVEGLSATCSLTAWEAKKLPLKAKVTAPEQWNAERPRVYRLVAELKGPNGPARIVEQKIGFRQIKVAGNQLLFNGQPLKIRGISRLEAHPLMGRALTREICRRDAELMKAANFNACRATIFPPHASFLDDCDELGIYVEDEGPACWFNMANDLNYGPLYIGIMSEQIERDRNHPSVFLWSLVNESEYGRVMQMTHRYAKASDPTRICSITWAPDDSDLDLAVYHHPITVKRIEDSLAVPKPVFFDECLTPFHGHDYLAFSLDRPHQGPQSGRVNAVLVERRPGAGAGQGHRVLAALSSADAVRRQHLQNARARNCGRYGVGDAGWLAPAPAGILAFQEAVFAHSDRGKATGHPGRWEARRD
jgi:hypothetical protein